MVGALQNLLAGAPLLGALASVGTRGQYVEVVFDPGGEGRCAASFGGDAVEVLVMAASLTSSSGSVRICCSRAWSVSRSALCSWARWCW